MFTEAQMTESLMKVFENKKLIFEYDEEEKLFSKQIKYDSSYYTMLLNIYVAKKGICILVSSDVEVKKNIKAATEFIARVNYSLNNFGSFELDCDSGYHHYFHFISANDIEANADNLDEYITSHLALSSILFDYISNGMLLVMFKAETPKEAAEKTMKKIDNIGSEEDDDDSHDDIGISAE
ncbi:MAG: hypothetical protein IKP58_12705 [Victivallales bacterium]|nr:hypothetical protein [Victivallales bacterium]